MQTLRITQSSIGPDKYRVEVELEGPPRQTATAEFDFALIPQDQEDLRWYLEDYLQHPFDPAPTIAARIEGRTAEIGVELFESLFQSSDDARDLWATIRDKLNDIRVEIVTGVEEAASIPWELIRDPKTDVPLALRANAFVRAQPQVAQKPKRPETGSGPIGILLVICRPGGAQDVPFRSVATRLIKGLGESARETFQLDVLRPPTFERLGHVLRAAKSEGQPYHVVHFDGHGLYADVADQSVVMETLRKLIPLLLSGPRTGAHGYLAFENPPVDDNLQLVDGPALGSLLVETDVPVLVLNSCRSAHAEPSETPESMGTDVHTQVRALGSLAQEVMDAGVVGVVAMRYNVYVVTAAQFVANLYATLTAGHTLGEAVTLGRKQLHDQPLREIAYDPRPLQDWSVPVVYEAAPISLFPESAEVDKLTIELESGEGAPARGELDAELPPRPDAGFFGRDETLLALDRAFDTQSIVLLHAFAGSGKTATAAEFARWYALTGGVNGPVLFTSFEQYKPLGRVLDRIEQVFGKVLEQTGVHWLTLEDADRRDVALQVLKQIPVLWIWDNVEPVAGFPAGTESKWSAAEQKELVDFLRDARGTRAKFLLTSRRDEQVWLGDLPARITVPPMPMQERVQLARALAEKHRRRLTDVEDWRPLLRFTEGNPLTITVLVGQALRDGRKTRTQIEKFVTDLRAGEAAIEDEASEGRAKSLGASLSYGFKHAFDENERKQLALLHLFQGFVHVDTLRVMGERESDWCLPEVSGLTREDGIALLDRAAEIGLLTAHGGGDYSIHPALPWYFNSLFREYDAHSELAATRAYAEAMGALGDTLARRYEGGNRDVIAALTAEEANLLHARQLARGYGWGDEVTSTMQGLRSLYQHTGRWTEWARLVNEIVPQFVDPATDGPLPGHEEEWGLVTEYRARLACEARQWTEAERLQRQSVEWSRQRAAHALELAPEELDDAQRNDIRSLAVSLLTLSHTLRAQGNADCAAGCEEAYDLMQRIGDQAGAATTANNLGHSYLTIPDIRDLDKAEQWYRRSLELRDERDRLGRARSVGQLGAVAFQRFDEARKASKPEEEQLRHLNAAGRFYQDALDLLPPDAVDDLAVVHNELGNIYLIPREINRALPHYRESIRYEEMRGDVYGAAQTRFNVAVVLANEGRFADALDYAKAALRNYESLGDRAADKIQKTRELIAQIEQDMKDDAT